MSKIFIVRYFFLSGLLFFFQCVIPQTLKEKATKKNMSIITGAENTTEYLPLLFKKRVAVVGNQTSLIGDRHLIDSLLSLNVHIVKIFCPEHGFRGEASAGAKVEDGKDFHTGLPIISLYGKNKKPQQKDLQDIDVVLFDLQDVGVRFYTYISTLHYVMEACAQTNIPLIVLDRPNPNGFYVDGPIMEKEYSSFVGMHPVPVVYGMTIGEYAQMINGENWLSGNLYCNLKVIPLKHWKHDNMTYVLPVKPSPNLPNMTAVYLYPSLCFFEGTVISVGRGTDFPFQVYGHPYFENKSFSFQPTSIPGVAKYPKLEGEICYGLDLRNKHENILQKKALNLHFLIDAYNAYPKKKIFFTDFFYKLSGNTTLRQQIKNGMNEKEIRNSWQKDLNAFRKVRKKYLIY